MQPEILIAICVAVVIVFALLMGILSRYRKCPSDKILVIYGMLSTVKSEATRTVRQEAQSAYTAVRHSLCPSSSRISLWT